MIEIARWFVALGSTAAAVGLVFLGMGMAYVEPRQQEISVGWILMVGGVVATAIGWFVLRARDEPGTSTD
ncbi:MAG: hypothetical protein M3411_07050 [Chloroflexota bacterium]|nr:hypothetical protein [Chloroflexota bacterium]